MGRILDPVSNSGTSPVGKYLPSGWNANFLAKVATAGSAPARVAVVGDSIAQGYFSSDLRAKGWVSLLTNNLQTAYGDGGSGYVSSTLCTAFASAASVPAGAQTRYAAHGYNTQVGTWSRDQATAEGPNMNTAMTSIDLATPASMTFSVRGTTVKIYTKSNGGSNAAWKYSVDGGTAVNVTDGSGSNIQVTSITGLAAGTHTVQVIYNGDGTKPLYLLGVTGENATGLLVNNYSIFGMLANGAGQTGFTNGDWSADWLGGYQYPADLGIWCLGANDAANSTATETYSQMVRRWMQKTRDGTGLNGNISLVVVMPHIGSYDSTTRLYQNYLTYIRGICEAYGAALIDVWSLGRNSWNYWNSLNYWGNGADPTTSSTDAVHLSDAGHAYVESVVRPVLLSAV